MAFNWSGFWTRAFTALIFVAVMMFGLLFNNWSIFLLLSVIYFGCWWEYVKLTEKITKSSLHIYAKLGSGLVGYHIFLLLTGNHLQLWNYSIQTSFSLPILLAGLVLFLWGIFKTRSVSNQLLLRILGGLFYIAVPIGLLVNLSIQQGLVHVHIGNYLVLYIIGSIWINDTMAYLCGSIYGKTPLTKISPKKTWEGTISGIVFSAALTWLLFSLIFLRTIEWQLAIPGATISFLTAIAGTFGDLFESKLKRQAGVKDSGNILPGHGGFLDRFDSVLFAVPFVWIFVKFVV